MEKKPVWPVFRMIIFLGQLFFQALSTTLVLRLNMLPGKFVALFLGAMVVLAVCTGLLVFMNVTGKLDLWRKIISGVLAFMIMLGCAGILRVALDARKLVDDVTGDFGNTRNTYIIVLPDNTVESVKETKGYRYGVLEDFDLEHTQQMIDLIQKEIGEQINLINYQQASVMLEALFNREVDALIMHGVSLSLMIEQPGYEDLLSRIRVLHTLPYKDVEPEDNSNKETLRDSFVMYISGSDTRSTYLNGGLSDTNILAAVNPNTKQVLLVNTPRDYYVPNPAGNGALDKLTHCGNYGIECSVEALETLYQIEVDHYMQINFTGFKKLIDAIDGITVYSDQAFTAVTGTYFQKGENILDGQKALDFARERYNLRGGDDTRGQNQMRVIGAVVDKLSSSKTIISNYSEILDSLEGMFVTNFTREEISDFVKAQLEEMGPWTVRSFAVTGTGGYAETYSWKGEELYITWPDEAGVAYASNLISRILTGEILTVEDLTMPE